MFIKFEENDITYGDIISNMYIHKLLKYKIVQICTNYHYNLFVALNEIIQTYSVFSNESIKAEVANWRSLPPLSWLLKRYPLHCIENLSTTLRMSRPHTRISNIYVYI